MNDLGDQVAKADMANDRHVNVQTGTGFLAQLEPGLRKQIETRLRSIRVPKGRMVVEYGTLSDDVYLVVDGTLQILIYSPSGREVSITTTGPGDIFGELAALDGARRSAAVIAATSGHLRVMSRADFRACLEVSPRASLWVSRRLARQIRALNNRLFELATLNVNNRLHFELLRQGLTGSRRPNSATIDPAPTHQELANRIGTHREAVTRELRDLAKRGILHQQGRRLEILDLERLSSIVRQMSGQIAGVYMAPHGPDGEPS